MHNRRDSLIAIGGWAAEGIERPLQAVKNRPQRFRRQTAQPPDGPPFLPLTIDLSRVTGHNYERLVDEFKSIVRQAKKQLPPEHQQPDVLHYLRRVSRDEFTRDLSRYDLHMNEGFSYRQIAIRELAAAGQAERGPSRRSTASVERAVRSSVERVYRAIFRRPYIARRRRLEANGGPGEYACSEHGRDCPETCATLKTWMRQMEPSLPAPHSGAESRALRRRLAEEHRASAPPRATPSRPTTPSRRLTPRRRKTA
jgi:hypothetical protein